MPVKCRWEGDLVKLLWKTVQSCPKKLKIKLPYDRSISLLSIYLKGFKSTYYRDTCASVSIAELPIIAELQNQCRCLATENRYRKVCIYFQSEQRMNLCHFRRMDMHDDQCQKDKYSIFLLIYTCHALQVYRVMYAVRV